MTFRWPQDLLQLDLMFALETYEWYLHMLISMGIEYETHCRVQSKKKMVIWESIHISDRFRYQFVIIIDYDFSLQIKT